MPPAPPSTGAHGGGGLYGQGKDRACIAALPIGTYDTGAAAPWEARIGIALQALKTAALYWLGPPGRRRCHVSEIPGQSPQPSVGATCGRPPLSPLGLIVEDELLCLDGIYANIRLDKFVVMPNHIHLILIIESDGCGRPQVAPTISRVMKQFKGIVTKRAGFPLWQKSFHDHVIRNEADYLRVWDYIDTNPLKWREDCYYV